MKKNKSKGVVVHVGQYEFLKINTGKREWRDSYHWILTLSWPQFAALISGAYLAINVFFAALYALGGDCIAEMPAGSFPHAFFFSVQTMATVGYGHEYPATLYGNIVTTIEIMVGMFSLAVSTGLIFVRFSRPSARIVAGGEIARGAGIGCAVVEPDAEVRSGTSPANAGRTAWAHRADASL